jgi:ATP-binding cassette subfamily B (MDR/TAP) protein 1
MLATLGISETSALASDSKKAKETNTSIFSLLDRKSNIDSGSHEGSILDEVKGDTDFQHVSFRYPSRPDVQILSDFTLHIPAGKVSVFLSLCNIIISMITELTLWFHTDNSTC